MTDSPIMIFPSNFLSGARSVFAHMGILLVLWSHHHCINSKLVHFVLCNRKHPPVPALCGSPDVSEAVLDRGGLPGTVGVLQFQREKKIKNEFCSTQVKFASFSSKFSQASEPKHILKL